MLLDRILLILVIIAFILILLFGGVAHQAGKRYDMEIKTLNNKVMVLENKCNEYANEISGIERRLAIPSPGVTEEEKAKLKRILRHRK